MACISHRDKHRRAPGQRVVLIHSPSTAAALEGDKAAREKNVPTQTENATDAASTILGHAELSVTQVYAEADRAAASAVMSAIG